MALSPEKQTRLEELRAKVKSTKTPRQDRIKELKQNRITELKEQVISEDIESRTAPTPNPERERRIAELTRKENNRA